MIIDYTIPYGFTLPHFSLDFTRMQTMEDISQNGPTLANNWWVHEKFGILPLDP